MSDPPDLTAPLDDIQREGHAWIRGVLRPRLEMFRRDHGLEPQAVVDRRKGEPNA